MTAYNPNDFRNALGNFATGVTVVTAKDVGDSGYVGVTANSFNSVSMDPPLVLWSLGKNARSLPAYEAAEHFAIHILASDQIDISNHFATQQPDKFSSIDFEKGIGDVPVLKGCATVFQCKTKMMYEGGDHIIFVGEVLDFKNSDKPGLVFSKGKYALSQAHPELGSQTGPDEQEVFVGNYIHYLLEQASNQFENSFMPIINQSGINSHYEWRVLAMLNDRNEQTADELAANAPAKYAFMVEVLNDMINIGMIDKIRKEGVSYYNLTANGQRKANELLDAAKTHEQNILENVSLTDNQLKESLKQLISALRPDTDCAR